MKTQIALTAGIALALAGGTAAMARSAQAPYANPKGITLQPLGKAQGYGLDKDTASVVPRAKVVFANAEGLTLYTRDADPVGNSACDADCLKMWLPATIAAGATPVENWSVIVRTDGSKQWAYQGKALYTYVEDKDPGSIAGSSPARFSRGEFSGPRGQSSTQTPKDNPVPEGWKVSYFLPLPAQELPSGFGVKEVQDALGIALVDNHEHTLYAADAGAKPKTCKSEACIWVPVTAPAIAEAIGDFTPQWRDDEGIRQWSYKGKLLYTYAGDLVPGDANGVGVDKGIEAARTVKYFTPAGVTLNESLKLGKVLADSKGRTLYYRDSYIFQSGSGHSLRRGSPIRPAVGRDLKTDPHCKDDCQKNWHPFLAPTDAQADGNWDVYTRPDGTKQWAYQGYALWTYDADKKPGDALGTDDYQIFMSHDNHTLVDIGTPYDGPTALFWIAANP